MSWVYIIKPKSFLGGVFDQLFFQVGKYFRNCFLDGALDWILHEKISKIIFKKTC